jgi:hypothetical protein
VSDQIHETADCGGETGTGAVLLEFADKFSTVVGLPGDIPEDDPTTLQVRLDAMSEGGAGGGTGGWEQNGNGK